MANYISFRDVGNVLTAGGTLATQGANLKSKILAGAGPLESPTVFTKKDGYSQNFWNDNYAATVEGGDGGPRHAELIKQSKGWAGEAQTLGELVVTATTTLIWQDAIAGAQLMSARAKRV